MAAGERGRGRGRRLYLGVDVGGTKILSALVEENGAILARQRISTPRETGPEQAIVAVERLIEKLLKEQELAASDLTAIGVAVPGVVDPDVGRIVVTPNMHLTGVALGSYLQSRFHVPIALGNDCNLGALGESWLGSARKARSVMAVLVGTGIGGGIVRKGRLWRGARESAGEVGHIIMEIGGPTCGCGNRGCLEALASRTAIENQLRAAVAAGRTTVLSELLQGDFSIIRSGALRQALEADDPLVSEIMRRAAETLGYACLTFRHLLDPEVIVLGGGVIEACSDFMLPIVENIVGSDQLPGARPGGRVLLCALGDDAVVLGAVALARTTVGRSPFRRRFAFTPKYPTLGAARSGAITVGRKSYDSDVYIMVNGEVKKRKKKLASEEHPSSHVLGTEELQKVCAGGPEVLFVGTGSDAKVNLTDEGQRYLNHRSIECRALPSPKIAAAYNKCRKRKAAVIHLNC